MKYYVTHSITARYVSEVDADTINDAIKKADEQFAEADFGVAKDVDGTATVVKDENGNHIWEK